MSRPGIVLVADDNRMNRLLLGRSLEQQGHTVVFAENGREALELLRQQRFDVLLLDVLMPELDGYRVLEELRNDTLLRDIPVVMTSALDELDSVVKCIEMGAEDYLTKPINPVLLNARVIASVEKKRLRDQQRELISKFATKEVAEDLLASGLRPRRQARRRDGDVLRHPVVHVDRRGVGADRDDRAAERLLHADDGRDRRRRRHRQPDDRRRSDGDLRCADPARRITGCAPFAPPARWSS